MVRLRRRQVSSSAPELGQEWSPQEHTMRPSDCSWSVQDLPSWGLQRGHMSDSFRAGKVAQGGADSQGGARERRLALRVLRRAGYSASPTSAAISGVIAFARMMRA